MFYGTRDYGFVMSYAFTSKLNCRLNRYSVTADMESYRP